MRTPTRGQAVTGAIVGGALWALTPLRQPIFDAGRSPDEGDLFFRGYNALIVVVAVLLTVALLRLRHEAAARPVLRVGWWTMLLGHLLILLGSLVGVVLGGWAPDLVMPAQDLGFLGAVLATLGALVLGVACLRGGGVPRGPSVLFAMTLPVGVLGIVALEAVGVPEDYLGLPLTVLYGGAWLWLGATWTRSESSARVA